MGDGTEQNPYTREDVLRLIKENSGKAEGLDLSGKVFEQGINLRGLNLEGIILKKAILVEAHLEGASLGFARLEGTFLVGAHLKGADLMGAYLKGAVLSYAHLEGAYLGFAEFSPDTRLEDVNWGNYILGDERSVWLALTVVDTYRRLKQWHTNAGLYEIAGKFFYREMEAKREAQSWKNEPASKLWSWVMRLLCGYGEKPERVVVSAIVIIFGLASAYFAFNSVWEWSALWKSLYFSAVSFTSLGYGGWIDDKWININNNWIKGIGVAESFLGVFMTGLFLVTFTQKMTR